MPAPCLSTFRFWSSLPSQLLSEILLPSIALSRGRRLIKSAFSFFPFSHTGSTKPNAEGRSGAGVDDRLVIDGNSSSRSLYSLHFWDLPSPPVPTQVSEGKMVEPSPLVELLGFRACNQPSGRVERVIPANVAVRRINAPTQRRQRLTSQSGTSRTGQSFRLRRPVPRVLGFMALSFLQIFKNPSTV